MESKITGFSTKKHKDIKINYNLTVQAILVRNLKAKEMNPTMMIPTVTIVHVNLIKMTSQKIKKFLKL